LLAADVEEHPGAQLPLDTAFTSVVHGPVALRRVMDGSQPIVLVIAYARCTMLCSLVLRGATSAVRKLHGTPNRLVIVSLDSRETLDEARRKFTALREDVRGGDVDYLIGNRRAIDGVASTLGFRYAWDARTEQYAHPAVIFVVTPTGRVSRYLHGLEFPPDVLSPALRAAAAETIVTTTAAEVMRCFRFDPALRRDGARALLVLRIGGALILLMLLTMITILVRWERRRGRTP
jgi:protein SCO1/2